VKLLQESEEEGHVHSYANLIGGGGGEKGGGTTQKFRIFEQKRRGEGTIIVGKGGERTKIQEKVFLAGIREGKKKRKREVSYHKFVRGIADLIFHHLKGGERHKVRVEGTGTGG